MLKSFRYQRYKKVLAIFFTLILHLEV